MANSCWNAVTFTGDVSDLVKVKLLFKQMEEAFKIDLTMGKPSFVTTEKGHLYDIEFGNQAIYFYTKWTPNLETIRQIADHFNLEYRHQYEEYQSYIFGEAEYRNGEFTNFFLEQQDYNQFAYDFEAGKVIYQGQAYDDETTLYQLILDQKKSGNLPNIAPEQNSIKR